MRRYGESCKITKRNEIVDDVHVVWQVWNVSWGSYSIHLCGEDRTCCYRYAWIGRLGEECGIEYTRNYWGFGFDVLFSVKHPWAQKAQTRFPESPYFVNPMIIWFGEISGSHDEAGNYVITAQYRLSPSPCLWWSCISMSTPDQITSARGYNGSKNVEFLKAEASDIRTLMLDSSVILGFGSNKVIPYPQLLSCLFRRNVWNANLASYYAVYFAMKTRDMSLKQLSNLPQLPVHHPVWPDTIPRR